MSKITDEQRPVAAQSDEGDPRLASSVASPAADAAEEALLLRHAQQTSALLDALFAGAPVGLGFWDLEHRFVRINDALAAMNGLPPGDHVGKSVREVLPDLAPLLEPIWDRVIETGETALRVEVSGSTPAQPGVRRTWVASYYPVPGPTGEAIGVGAVVSEITDRRRAEQRMKLQHAVTRVLADAETAADAIPLVLETLCLAADWDVACFWSSDSEQPRVTWMRPGVAVDGFIAMTERLGLTPDTLPGRVSTSAQVEWIEEFATAPVPRASIALAEGLVSALAFPVLVGREGVGVIEAFSRERRDRDDELLESLGGSRKPARAVPSPQTRRGGANAPAPARADGTRGRRGGSGDVEEPGARERGRAQAPVARRPVERTARADRRSARRRHGRDPAARRSA